MKTKHFLLILAILAGVTTAQGDVTFKIGGENAVGNTDLLRQYGMTLGTKTVNGTSFPCLTLNNSQVSVADIGIEYTYTRSNASSPATQPLYIVVKGICAIESSGSYGLKTNQTIYVTSYETNHAKDSCSLYIKGTDGVYMQTQTSISLGAVDGVELICEGTSGAGIVGSPDPRLKNTYYGGVVVQGEATSLIAKGSTYAMVAIHTPLYENGATIQYPSGLTFDSNNGAYATTEWMHITATGLPINTTNFPDNNFRDIVSSRYDSHEPDGYLSRYERSLVTEMDIRDKRISNSTGVNYFTSLITLYGGSNNYESIDISSLKELVTLDLSATGLMSVDVSNQTKLQTLNLYGNRLAGLDVSHNTRLTELNCAWNLITELDVSMCPELLKLSCGAHGPAKYLTSLNLSGCSRLEELNCSSGKLTSLDLSDCTALKSLVCSYNGLTALDVSGFADLKILECSHNELTSLNLEGTTALEALYCLNGNFTSLDLSSCTALRYLSCDFCRQLTQLNASGLHLSEMNCKGCSRLTSIDCSNNQLTSLNVTDCSVLREIHCQQNKLSGTDLDAFIATLPTTTSGTLYLIDEDNGDENVCTDEQAIAIYNKGWNPLRYADGEWKPILIEGDFTVEAFRYRCFFNTEGLPDHAEVVGYDSAELVNRQDLVIADTVGYGHMKFPVTIITENIFYESRDFSNTQRVIIPSTIQKIKAKAFWAYSNPAMFVVKSATPPATDFNQNSNTGANPFSNNTFGAALIVPEGCEARYRSSALTNPWWYFYRNHRNGFYDSEGRIYVHATLNDGPVNFGGLIDNESTALAIPESVTTSEGTFAVEGIRGYSFMGSAVEEVVIPTSVTAIGDRAFYNMPSLKAIRVGWKEDIPVNATTGAYSVFNNTDLTDVVLYVPAGTKAAYAETMPWMQIPTIIEQGDVNGDGVVTIADVTALVNIILGKNPAPENGVADVNGDGGVTIADVTALVNIILGKD